jgi:hypothetical protein
MTNKELPKDTMHSYDVIECGSSVRDVRLHHFYGTSAPRDVL